MIGYIVRRLLQSVLSLLCLAALSFFLLKQFPGSPLSDQANLPTSVLKELQASYRTEESWFIQFITFLKFMFSFQTPPSLAYPGQSVGDVILGGSRVTIQLGLVALALSLIGTTVLLSLRYLLGLKALIKNIQWIIFSLPTLFVAPLCIYLFGFALDLTPVTLDGSLASYFLPVFILALRPMATLSQLAMDVMDRELSSRWALNYQGLGFSKGHIVGKSLRMAWPALFAYFPPMLASLFSGSLIVETIFSADGLGSRFVESILQRDYFLASSLTLYFGIILVILSFLFDLLMLRSDPRLRL